MSAQLTKNKILPLRVLVLGGKTKFNQMAQAHERSKDNGHVLFFARTTLEAWTIIQTQPIDRIVIEAFMENAENETPFQILSLIKGSAYTDIPVLVVATEPSHTGMMLANSVKQAITCFGAEFQLISRFVPEDSRAMTESAFHDSLSYSIATEPS